ncbi:hypothetical protein niasHS_015008 [Heterodera schachtii]|uniref:Uncharacterized protein n=1 Tax=Heterodera schachtii TaxID=97005 RepID=A0ABD2ILK8_HETSC
MTKAAFGRRGECRGGQIMQREKCHLRECQRNQAADLPSDLAVSSLGYGKSVPNLTFENPLADDNGTSKCLCGCKLSERPQGMFFASFCPTKNVQQWQLEFGKPFRVQIILTDRLMGEEAPVAFEVIRDNGEEKEMVWNSENNPHDESIIIEGIFKKAAIFELKNAISDNNGDQWQKKRTDFGILVEYKITAFEEIGSAAGGSSTLLQLMRILCSKGPKFANCSALFVFSLLFVLFAVFLPPIVFVFVIKRHTKKKLAKQFGHIYHKNVRDSSALLVSTHCHNQIDSEMIRSADGTESTKLSNSLANSAKRKSPPTEAQRMTRGNGAVGQRSIGIQLSRLSTPRCASRQFPPHRRRPSANHNGRQTSADNLSDSIGSATIENNSNLAEDYWNEDDDFGAEQLQLGGRWANELENSSSHFVSDIDIDQIARREASDNNWYFWPNSTRLSSPNFPSAELGSHSSPLSGGVCQNGGQFTGTYCSGERLNECGVLYQKQWTAICISGRCCTNPARHGDNEWDSDFERGRAVCARYGAQYSRTVCKQASNCGPHDYFACISGFCCYLGRDGTKWEGSNDNRRRQSQWEDEDEGEEERIGNHQRGNGVHRSHGVGGLCFRNARFPHFMGHFCVYDRQCPRAFDQSTSRPIPIRIRCIDGACCGETVIEPTGREARGKGRSDGREATGGRSSALIPNRLSEAFCYEGTRTDRQCFAGVDCRHDESCVNQLCCPRGFDEMNYSCGGLASNGSCGPNGQCVVAGKRLECVSSGVCCECPAGQPQPGVSECSSDQQCREGFSCHGTGFCCPQCPGGQLPFGSCNKGRCAKDFVCRPGNICCEDRFGELAIGTKENWRERQRTDGGRDY